KRHFGDRSTITAVCILAVPVVIHWVYDALAFSEGIYPALSVVINILFVGLVFWIYKATMRRIDTLQRIDQSRMTPPPFNGGDDMTTPPPLPGQ
ncbi:MAG: hypothetical protein IJV11_05395, partial [Muribaculaceae bacterium]|nr:hypothetical protein [Muribaculaceae bacterium]